MNSVTSMKSKLMPIGIYKLDNDSNVYKELVAYAEVLDELFAELDEMIREYYIDTAENYGITRRELIMGPERTDLSIEKRRQMLKVREQAVGLSCTVKDFENILLSYGVGRVALTEHFSEQKYELTFLDGSQINNKRWVSERIVKDFPLHLDKMVSIYT